jgi:formylmethanofuran dehydrogenase subunit C
MLSLRYRGQTELPVEVEGILPETTRELSLAAIEQLPIQFGNQPVPLAEFFQVGGSPADEQIEWLGDLSGVHWIAARMASGAMRVAGSVGRHAGSRMLGGALVIEGDAGDWLGAELRGGDIRVLGNAGHLVGAAYRGSPRGMNRGTITVLGNAGDEIGATMRRGLIAVGGVAGDLAGVNMRAGTILLAGPTGRRHGTGMRRGTLAFMHSQPPLLPGFRAACRYRPDFLHVLLRHLETLGFPVPAEWLASDYELFCGDLIEGGRGELLVRR